MLRGQTLGLVGCGRIGQWMARYATAFGMQCLGYDPNHQPWPETIQQVDLPDLLRRARFISVHVPLSRETNGLLGPEEFALVGPGAVVVNTSRGEILDERALIAALEDGRVAAAGLDVLRGEPDVQSHPLVEYARTHANVLITPHIGGYSPEALQYVLAFSCRRIAEFFGR
jgi:D-3-phosphoglycerate dehydrogenase